MKILASILTLLLTSLSAEAAVKLSFSGHFESSSPATVQGNSLSLSDSFAGQFIFDANTPNQTGYRLPPSIPSGVLLLDNATSYFFNFNQDQSASVSINNGQPLHSSFPIEVQITDNSEHFMSGPVYDENGNVIGEKHSTAETFVPSTIYDVVSIETTPPSKPFTAPPEPNILLGDTFPTPPDITVFGIYALFAADTFSLDGANAPSQQSILSLSQPLFLVFNFTQVTNGQFINSTGLLDSYNLTEVPLPGTIWLFVSVLMGWQFGRRKSVF